jgi:hypothetical protein
MYLIPKINLSISMRPCITFIIVTGIMLSCTPSKTNKEADPETSILLVGTWQLISGTTIEKGDTTVTDYTKNQNMIKILNATHFAFLNHDLKKGKDSTATFIAGGGVYTLEGDQYTEYLEYCSAREWEGNTFQFTVTIQNDTLIQRGVEKVENMGVERMNIEKYKRVKN